MLYTSTRNINDTFTAHRALNEETAPDGGMYVPYRVPVLSPDVLTSMRKQPVSQTVADILNLFFSTQLSDSQVVSSIGDFSFRFHEIAQNVLFTEMWHTPDSNSDYLTSALYRLMTGKREFPKGWAYVGIEIALLFAIYGAIDQKYKEFDVIVPADDFAELIAVLYAKDMGLPVKGIICVCGENGVAWDLVNKGELDTSHASLYTECFLHRYLCQPDMQTYLDTCARKGVYLIDEIYMEQMNCISYAAVVSSGRIDTVISSMHSANGYHIDCGTALAYGGLQDYRASIGTNERTIILSRKRPERIKE